CAGLLAHLVRSDWVERAFMNAIPGQPADARFRSPRPRGRGGWRRSRGIAEHKRKRAGMIPALSIWVRQRCSGVSLALRIDDLFQLSEHAHARQELFQAAVGLAL